MADMERVMDRVFGVVAEIMNVPRADLKTGMTFVGDLDADSLDNVEMLMGIEDAFEIIITDEEAARCNTIGEVITLVVSELE